MDTDMKREIILDNYNNPINKVDGCPTGYRLTNVRSQTCIDNIDLFVNIDNNIIKDICFNGEACAVSTASTSIMIKNLIGKTIDEALIYLENFDKMLNEEEFDQDIVGEACVFDETYKQLNRRNCVTIPYKGIKEALKEYLTNNK